MSKTQTKTNRRNAFTLVEMVVVVLIMGIIAAVAMPRMTASAQTAKTNTAKQSLAAIRNAIELYKADNDVNPPDAATLTTVLQKYIKGPFPAAPLGANAGSATVAVGVSPIAVVAGGAGWAYNATTGDFYLNDAIGLTW